MTHMQGTYHQDSSSCGQWIIVWSTCQGLSANVERYRNSPLMHDTVSSDCNLPCMTTQAIGSCFPNLPRHFQSPGSIGKGRKVLIALLLELRRLVVWIVRARKPCSRRVLVTMVLQLSRPPPRSSLGVASAKARSHEAKSLHECRPHVCACRSLAPVPRIVVSKLVSATMCAAHDCASLR